MPGIRRCKPCKRVDYRTISSIFAKDILALYMEENDIIKSRIHLIRGEQVMLDSDLAELYGVPTKNLKRQVRRNAIRFPEDFMFELTQEEFSLLRCQNGASKERGGNQ